MINKVYLDIMSFIVPDFNARTINGIRRIFPNMVVNERIMYNVLTTAEAAPLYLPTIMDAIARSRETLPSLSSEVVQKLADKLAWDNKLTIAIPAFLLTADEFDAVLQVVRELPCKYRVFGTATTMINEIHSVVIASKEVYTTRLELSNVTVCTLDAYTKHHKPVDPREQLIVRLNNAIDGLKQNVDFGLVLNDLGNICNEFQQTQRPMNTRMVSGADMGL